ncbi:hypothetical protein PVL29_015581 [Vitis rotundifolia]|uniref:Receptor-like serine/threonine-protein kinase n=1 Tax=Vitis rotundifolia TaxID=103349 RepID=A0AA39DLW1_VITRO|nr:hypothetical protein PVL29_015581 [Vitis rotundifolia]
MLSAIFFFLCSILCCSARDTITPDNLLIDDGGGTLVSASQTFELGFFIPEGRFNNGKYIGIWYNGLKERTVVWVANGADPLLDASVGALAIAGDGNLKLVNESGAAYWFTNLGSSSSMDRVAKLMDSGNFILSDNRSGEILWESFKNPTDDFLPGMIMDGSLTLTSWVSPVEPAPGSSTFKQDDDEDQYIILKDSIIKYWRSEESEGMCSAVAELLLNFSKTRKPTGSQFFRSSYTRLVMNFTREIRYLSWDNYTEECVLNACGNFGSCNVNNAFMCKCLPGFEPNSLERWTNGDFSGGCSKKTTLCGDTILILKMSKVRKYDIELSGKDEKSTVRNLIPYPLSTGPNCGDPMYFNFRCDNVTDQVWFALPNGSYQITSITPERSKFLIQVNDIDNCEAQNSQDKKILQLNPPFGIASWCNADTGNSSSSMSMKGQYEIEISWNPPPEPVCTSATDCKDWPNLSCRMQNRTRRCFCNQNFKWNTSSLNCTQDGGNLAEPPTPANQKSSSLSSSALVVVVGIVIAVVVVALLCIIENRTNPGLHLYHSESRVKHLIDSEQLKENDKKGIDVPFFNLEDILSATDHFSDANKLGQGGFGPLYKGKFPEGREIAVNRLSRASGQGLQEFKNEVVLIAKLQHQNLVRILGYCIERDEKILLYEYMPNKSFFIFSLPLTCLKVLFFFFFSHITMYTYLKSFFPMGTLQFRTLCLLLNWETRFDIILGIAQGLLHLHQDSRLKNMHRDLKTGNILLDDEMNPKISDFGLARIFESKQVEAWKLWKEDKVLELMEQTLSETCNTNEFLRCVNIELVFAVVMLSSDTVTLPVPKQPAFVVRRDLSSTTSSSSKPEASLNSESLATIGEGR